MSDRKKIKVLHVDNSTDYTGAFRALYDFIDDQQFVIDSVVILPKGSKCISYFEGLPVKVYEIPFLEISKSVKNVMLYFPVLIVNAWRVKKIIQKERVEVLHSNDLYNMVLYITRFFFGIKQPLITHVRLMPSGYNALLYNFWKYIHIRFSDKIVGVSQAVKKAFGYDAMEVVYDVKWSQENHPPYRVSNESKQKFRFLYLSNYISGKGNDLALEAFVNVLKQNPHATLTFAGGFLGNTKNEIFKSRLMQKVEQEGLNGSVFFEGFVKDVEAKMKAYDAVLNFSVSESFSMTCFDALRFGIPLIASDSGGPAELFEHGKSGLLVNNKDIQEMAAAMLLLMGDRELRDKISVNSKLYLSQLLARNKNFDQLSALMTGLGNK